jgi:hypothetical protein
MIFFGDWIMQSAVDSLCGRFLDFSTIPLTLATVTSAHTKDKDDSSSSVMTSAIDALSWLQSSRDDAGSGAVGIELTTELLRHCNDQNSKLMFGKLNVDPSMQYSLDKLLSALDVLYDKGLIEVVLCASNVFTLPVALAVRQWVDSKQLQEQQQKKISFLATEVLRGHPRSPGLLLAPSAATNAGKASK